jgi:dihydrofolate synthase/folylpolyglutamate synthase
MAFDVFARESVDFAVLEVGMGGRLDATNIVKPEVCAITQIAFDHESFLGHSIEQIAGEKAGIIKAGVDVVSAAEDPAAREVIRSRAAELGAPLVETDTAYGLEILSKSGGFYSAVVTDRRDAKQVALDLPLAGRYQVRNAVTALAVARILAHRGSTSLDDRAIADGIAAVRWPGRLERVGERPAVYLDGTHNPAGARELAAFWDENFAGRRIYLVYGAVRDKAVDEVAGVLFPRATKVFITAAKQPRAISAEALAEMTGHLSADLEAVPEPGEALERALTAAQPEDIVFVTGSLYLVGDLRRWWHSRAPSTAR